MKTLTILSGIPASGKSTYAKRLAKKNPKTTIIANRDSIRGGIGEYWVPSREGLVTEIEHFIIKKGLEMNYNVIVDATNLNGQFLKEIEEIGRSFSDVNIIYKHFATPFLVCIYRDLKRGLFGGRKVGYKVIKSFYERYYKNTKP